MCRLFHATGGIIIVMDPKTGEILALGNQPSYDPNHFEKADERQFKNRAVVDIYEPGSTFKPIIAATALSAGTYDTKRVWHDPGVVWASGHPIKNWNEESYGDVRLVDIIKWSINTGFAHIGLLTGGETMTDYAKRFGFGRSTGIELPGEGVGLLFEPKNMRPIDVATMSIGQGIAVTPLQMVQAYSALANGGKMVKPHIIASIKNADGSDYKVTEKEVIGQPITEAVASEVKDMMEKEVSEGGGSNAQVPGYHMAGKTGTAQKIDAFESFRRQGHWINPNLTFRTVVILRPIGNRQELGTKADANNITISLHGFLNQLDLCLRIVVWKSFPIFIWRLRTSHHN